MEAFPTTRNTLFLAYTPQMVLRHNPLPKYHLALPTDMKSDEDRRRPRCGTPGAVSRARQTACGGINARDKKDADTTTGTPLAGLHHKERLPGLRACLSAGNTIRESAADCGIDVSTEFRRQHRFLAARYREPSRIKGIVRADKTYFPESSRGDGAQSAACRGNRFRFW